MLAGLEWAEWPGMTAPLTMLGDTTFLPTGLAQRLSPPARPAADGAPFSRSYGLSHAEKYCIHSYQLPDRGRLCDLPPAQGCVMSNSRCELGTRLLL